MCLGCQKCKTNRKTTHAHTRTRTVVDAGSFLYTIRFSVSFVKFWSFWYSSSSCMSSCSFRSSEFRNGFVVVEILIVVVVDFIWILLWTIFFIVKKDKNAIIWRRNVCIDFVKKQKMSTNEGSEEETVNRRKKREISMRTLSDTHKCTISHTQNEMWQFGSYTFY